ncbi:MAG: hypothetical protein ACF8QF_09940 [Phycisphaerales bacterium]
MQIRKTLSVCTLAAGLAVGGLAIAQQGRAQGGGQDMGQRLIEGLRNTPGCLGVDAGQFMSGKNAIIAWFENKAAAKSWYYSDTHMAMMGGVGADPASMKHAPLEHVADDTPIMVIASITFTETPELEGVPMPINQIAIELYAPLPGGASINGRLAPDTFKVEHHKFYDDAGE